VQRKPRGHIHRNNLPVHADLICRPCDHVQCRAHLREEAMPLGCQFDHVVAPNEQPLSELLFELPNLVADCAWCDAKSLGCCLQTPQPGCGFKRPHGIEHGLAQSFPHGSSSHSGQAFHQYRSTTIALLSTVLQL
jgi:hypothetical protein